MKNLVTILILNVLMLSCSTFEMHKLKKEREAWAIQEKQIDSIDLRIKSCDLDTLPFGIFCNESQQTALQKINNNNLVVNGIFKISQYEIPIELKPKLLLDNDLNVYGIVFELLSDHRISAYSELRNRIIKKYGRSQFQSNVGSDFYSVWYNGAVKIELNFVRNKLFFAYYSPFAKTNMIKLEQHLRDKTNNNEQKAL